MATRDLQQEQPAFRRWLVDKLKQTRWAQLRGESVESVAGRLWVAPQALRLAQKELYEDARRRGRGPRQLGTSKQMRPAPKQMELCVPQRVHADWWAHCAHARVGSAALLRSLIHALLSSESNPRHLDRWRYQGQLLMLKNRRRYKKWPWYLKTHVSHGAHRAMTLRARAVGVRTAALMRGQVIELLEGRLPHVEILGSPYEMWDDEDRYVTTPRLTKGTQPS